MAQALKMCHANATINKRETGVRKVIGGIHPEMPWRQDRLPENATWSEFRPDRIYLSMCQGDEAPCRPVVKVGEKVKAGQRIGEAADKKSVDIHSGISGTVVAIRDEKNALTGDEEVVVVIENDGRDEAITIQDGQSDAFPERKALGEILRNCGIVGMGGAVFPSHAKIGGDHDLDTLLANGAECEPLLSADATLMAARPDAVIDGCKLIMAALRIPSAIVGIEADMAEAIAMMRKQVEKEKDIRVETLPHIYPMGGEIQLILNLTGREVPARKRLSDVGVVVFNLATLTAVSDAVRRGIPLTHRICSVVGDVTNPQNIRFPVGSSAQDIIDFCGGWIGKPSRLVVGGPMMGKTADRMDVPLPKTANGLLLINCENDFFAEERPCIRCDRCSEACPVRLMPLFIDAAARKEDWSACSRLSAESCINCGCCSYVCPSFIPLAATIAKAAKTLKSRRKEA